MTPRPLISNTPLKQPRFRFDTLDKQLDGLQKDLRHVKFARELVSFSVGCIHSLRLQANNPNLRCGNCLNLNQLYANLHENDSRSRPKPKHPLYLQLKVEGVEYHTGLLHKMKRDYQKRVDDGFESLEAKQAGRLAKICWFLAAGML